MKEKIEAIKSKLREPKKVAGPPRFEDGLSTGSTPLNLACSGRPNVGFVPGQFVLFVGDTNSGKSFISLNCFAEAAQNPKFDKYRFIYDGPEGGAKMDIERFYGKAVKDRLEHPSPKGHSRLIEEFYFNLRNLIREKRPFIYVLDSVDALDDAAEEKKFNKKANAFLTNSKDKSAGSMGMGKAKANSVNLRRMLDPLAKTGSILVVINQTRDNTNIMTSRYKPKTRAGGRALEFYSDVQIWSSVAGHIRSGKVYGKNRELGTRCKVHVVRTRLTGRDRTVGVNIYHNSGVDDVGGMIDWLIEEGWWEGSDENKTVVAKEFKFGGQREDLARKIEADGNEVALRVLVAEHWQRIEEQCASEVVRKKRYA